MSDKIPEMFTDDAIDNEIFELSQSIIKIKDEMDDFPRSMSGDRRLLKEAEEDRQRVIDRAASLPSYIAGYSAFKCDTKFEDKRIEQHRDMLIWREKRFNEIRALKLEMELRKSELEALRRKTPEQRVANYYKALCDEKDNPATTVNRLIELIKEFTKIAVYGESAGFAIECGELAAKRIYGQLVREKDNASTEEQFISLSKGFKAMNGYADTAKLALECDNEYRRRKEAREIRESEEKERRRLEEESWRQEEERKRLEEERKRRERYNSLVLRKDAVAAEAKAASTEEEMGLAEAKYRRIAEDFRKLDNYGNAKGLSNECDAERVKLGDKRIALHNKKITRKKTRKWLLIVLLGGIIGGLVFAFLNKAVVINLDNPPEVAPALIAAVVVGVLFGISMMSGGHGCGYGIGGFFIGTVVSYISVVLFTSSITTAIIGGVVVGVIVGAVVGGALAFY